MVQEKGMNEEHLLSDKTWFMELDKNGNGKVEHMEFDGALHWWFDFDECNVKSLNNPFDQWFDYIFNFQQAKILKQR